MVNSCSDYLQQPLFNFRAMVPHSSSALRLCRSFLATRLRWRSVPTHSKFDRLGHRKYSIALTRDVPLTFADALSSQPDDQVSVKKARKEHHEYTSALRAILPTLQLPASENFPDCSFVEDAAVVIGKQAVINRMGASSRQGEVDAVKKALVELGINVTDMREESLEATCDGGDCLFPVSSSYGGRHLFVGLSGRTNEAGVEVLRQVFEGGKSGVEVIAVPLVNGALHLKSVVSHVDEKTILAPRGPLGDETLEAMRVKDRGYFVIRLPDSAACNVVAINGIISAPHTKCEETKIIFEREMDERGLKIQYIDATEFAKKDGALTCKSILLDI